MSTKDSEQHSIDEPPFEEKEDWDEYEEEHDHSDHEEGILPDGFWVYGIPAICGVLIVLIKAYYSYKTATLKKRKETKIKEREKETGNGS